MNMKFFRSISLITRHNFSTVSNFSSLHLHEYLKTTLTSSGYSSLTTIQEKSLPFLLKSNNCLLLSETGTGKTLCYLLPILNEILKEKDQDPITVDLVSPPRHGALILSPSKELCVQIYAFARRLDPENRVNIMRAGSLSYKSPVVKFISDLESKTLKKTDVPKHIIDRLGTQNVLNTLNWNKLDLLINTPTHLEPLLRMKIQKNQKEIRPKIIVLDEVDLLLGDPFFSQSTKFILDCLADSTTQIIMSGASIMYKLNGIPTIDVLSAMFKGLIVIETANFHRLPQAIDHEVVRVDEEILKNSEKNAKIILLDFLEELNNEKVLIFCSSGEIAEEVNATLVKNEYYSAVFYSTLSNDIKAMNLARFREGEAQILCTTDLAARGLDFIDVHHVIQFDFPKDILTLLHRFGRTARMGQKGHVVSFITKKDEPLLEQFNRIQKKNEKIELIFKGKEGNIIQKPETISASSQ